MTDPVEPVVPAVPVVMVPAPPPPSAAQETETTLRTAGQRKINSIWEITQSAIAIAVTLTTLFASTALALRIESADKAAAFLLLSNAFFLVIGFYFGRTNHTRMGGVGGGGSGQER